LSSKDAFTCDAGEDEGQAVDVESPVESAVESTEFDQNQNDQIQNDQIQNDQIQNDQIQNSQDKIEEELHSVLEDLQSAANLGPHDLLVVGASSSEIVGKRIGTATSLDVGRKIVQTVLLFAERHGFDVAFQCCEHLNRALVVERELAQRRGYTVVSAVPVPGAGGAVAAEAYGAFQSPCLVEQIVAEAGIDLGDTLIGMHLLRVAVPIRPRCSTVGEAHVTMARTRPPLIGGIRAVYDIKDSPVWRRGAKS
jgi:uncharacterized protein (TIGR01440 family)